MSDSTEWFADEDFWSTLYPFMFPPSRFEMAPEEARQVLALAGHAAPCRVLDLACGPGRHAVALAELGCQVTGVDLSAFLLERARQRSREASVEVEWIRGDMRDFVRPAAFDVALCLFTSLGFFEDDEDNQKVLDQLFACLADAGTLVVDVSPKEVLARIFQPTGSREVGERLLVERRRVVSDWSRMSNEWLVIEKDRVRSFRLEHWIYSGRELAWMLGRAGFPTVDLFGSLEGEPYGTEARRLVAVARK
jgi:SAM-dependent methyltransferase